MIMEKRIYNINRIPVQDKEIEGYMNFESFIMKHNPGKSSSVKVNYRNIWLGSLSGVACIVIIVALYWVSLPKDTTSKPVTKTQESFIKPPVKQWNIPFKNIDISNKLDTIIKLASGTRLTIPGNCLVDEYGNTVNSGIEIRYREFRNPAEIFLSGIPMVYDSAGYKFNFESAGMIEVYAFHNQKPLKIKEGKSIKIELASIYHVNNYNVYFLDTVAKNWQYRGKDMIEIPKPTGKPEKEKRDIEIDTVAEFPQIIKKPVPPLLATKNKNHLKLDIIDKEFPDLEVYKNTIFEIDETYNAFNKKHAGEAWEDVVLTKGNKPLSYFIQFKSENDSCKYLVSPVLSDADYMNAKAKYDDLFQKYNAALENRKKLELSRFRSDSIMYVNESSEGYAKKSNIFRAFYIQRFGIWNCDRPRKLFNPKRIEPVIVVNDTTYEQNVYLADQTNNAVITCYRYQPILYEAKARNLIWMITYNNMLAVFTDDDFKKLPPEVAKVKVNMRIIRTPINSSDDFLDLYYKDFKE